MVYTTDDILASVKLRCLAPISQQTFSDSDLVMLMNEELELQLYPEILSVRQDFFLRPYTTAVLANIVNYPIPERASGNSLKQIYFVDGSINRRQLTLTDVDILRNYINSNGTPQFAFFQGDELYLVPTPTASTGGFLELWYFERCNKLVKTASVTKITAIAVGGTNTTFTVDTDQTLVFSTTTALDILRAKSPFVLQGRDLLPVSVTSTQIVFANTDVQNAALSTKPTVGDYISLSQQANIAMIPQEFHPILAEMVAARVLEALDHKDKLEKVNQKLKEMRTSVMKLINIRVEDQPPRIINRSGLVQSSGYGIYRNSFK